MILLTDKTVEIFILLYFTGHLDICKNFLFTAIEQYNLGKCQTTISSSPSDIIFGAKCGQVFFPRFVEGEWSAIHTEPLLLAMLSYLLPLSRHAANRPEYISAFPVTLPHH
jgi:hypothetical protein